MQIAGSSCVDVPIPIRFVTCHCRPIPDSSSLCILAVPVLWTFSPGKEMRRLLSEEKQPVKVFVGMTTFQQALLISRLVESEPIAGSANPQPQKAALALETDCRPVSPAPKPGVQGSEFITGHFHITV